MTGSQSTTWRTSSYSGSNGGNCVEVANTNTTVSVRDSKHPHAGHLSIETRTWGQFRTQVLRTRH